MSYRSLEIFIDGASKGNPGKAGVGVVICNGSEVIKNIAQEIGEATNNVAEYYALIYGLQEALILQAKDVVVNTDSELLARQLTNEYKVRHANLKPLFAQAQHLLSGFNRVKINHIPRQKNKGADRLATKAIKSTGKPKWLPRFGGEESPSSKG